MQAGGGEQVDDVADLFRHAAGSAALQHIEDFPLQDGFVRHASFHREEGPISVGQRVADQELLAEDGLVDGFAVEPDRPLVRRQC